MKYLRTAGFLLVLVILYVFLYRAYHLKINAFGCFDDCSSFITGYFINQGKQLYSEIFFNHQPLTGLMSGEIQRIFQPVNIYDLVLKHRQTLWIFSFLWVGFMSVRFGLPAVLFAILYEPVKFYIFGDRYLGEAFTVYPVAYLIFVLLIPAKNRFSNYSDAIFSAIAAWIAVFEREPYVPLALALYVTVIFTGLRGIPRKLSMGIFAVLSALLVLSFPLQDYYYNIVTINAQTVFRSEIKGNFISRSLLPAITYPVRVFTEGGIWPVFRHYVAGLLVIMAGLVAFDKRRKTVTLFIFTALILSNLRPEPPDKLFYEAFHMMVWFGTLCAIVAGLIVRSDYRIKWAGIISVAALFLYHILNPQSFIYDKTVPHEEYLTNYGHYQHLGTVIASLARPGDTLFLDGADDLIYWQAKLPSPYKYSLYTSVMPLMPVYARARDEMFTGNPPDFYYGSCQNPNLQTLSQTVRTQYIRLMKGFDQSCIYVHRNKLPSITEEQWLTTDGFFPETE